MDPVSARLQNCLFPHLWISATLCAAWVSTKMLLQSLKWKSQVNHPSYAPTQKPSKIPTAYLVTLSHAACGAPSSAPSSTCTGSPPPSTYLEGPSLPFHILFHLSPNSPSFPYRNLAQAATATSSQKSSNVPCRMWGWLLIEYSCPCTQ